MKTIALYFATAIAEIVGCYLPWLWQLSCRQWCSGFMLVDGVPGHPLQRPGRASRGKTQCSC